MGNDIIKPKEPALVMTVDEMTKAENNILNLKQLNFLLQPTPKNHIFQRPGITTARIIGVTNSDGERTSVTLNPN